MIILVDQDDVIADFEGGFLSIWREKHPDLPYIPLEERTIFGIMDQYPVECKPLIKEIFYSKGFHKNLPAVKGGIEALFEISKLGNDVFICTSPLAFHANYENCIIEKYEWVEKYLGKKWARKLIVTPDKTMMKGDILIDDNPEIRGTQEPIWEHILYDFPYNRHVTSKRRLTWDNWKEVLHF